MSEGVDSFVIKLTVNGKDIEIYGNSINRNLYDGGGTPVYVAKCYEVSKRGKVLRTGVAQLTTDWKVKHIFID